jgi:hypothetical protein
MDKELEKVKAHVDSCSVCSRAHMRVNDFCDEGKLLFFDYAKDREPVRQMFVTLTDEQYDRLVEETRRARRRGENN